ncbi:hypothetical protein LA521A_16740 [Lysobacter auxotrophicus]|uniref:Uncharacterized protein n=1 Tax=Lysobacter auxotrophicus TaxID=2992573 RepID=A0ABN6UJJ3_9GAMM|nr:hypothetical protein LA521A_16740 [Lysobacter auxotrophicus]
MNLTIQCLPPGWRLEALPPSRDRRECGIRLTSPHGQEITYVHKPFQFACEITRELQADLFASQHLRDQADPSLRIARPEQLADDARLNEAFNSRL